MRRAGAVSVSGAILLALLCIALISYLSDPVGAQEAVAGEATAQAGGSTTGPVAQTSETTVGAQEAPEGTTAGRQQVAQVETGALQFEEGTDATGRRARADRPAGPLSGTRVRPTSTDQDVNVERILIPRPDCELVPGETASFVLEDENGTQADFIDGENIQIKEASEGFVVTSNPPNPDDEDANNIVPRNERGGDDVLATGGLTIVTSTGIRCEDDATDPDPNPGEGTLTTPVAPDACANPRFVQTVGPRQGDSSTPFQTDEEAFGVTYTFDFPDGSPTEGQPATLTVLDQNGAVLGDAVRTRRDASDVFLLREGPGSFDLRVNVPDGDVRYLVRVFECRPANEEDDDGGDGGNTTGDDGQKADVMADTVPDDALPATGGPSLLLVGAGLALVACGASLIRFRR